MKHNKKLTILMSLLLSACMTTSIAFAGCGTEGPAGPKGDQGIQGVQGEKGDKGDKGDPGKDLVNTTYDEINIDKLEAVKEDRYDPKKATNAGMENMSYKNYSSKKEIYDAGYELSVKIGEEGEVLLKNKDNALPLKKGAKLTAFGFKTQWLYTAGANDNRGDDNPYYKEENVLTSLEGAGFKVNPSTINIYNKMKAAGGVVGNEIGIERYSNSTISTYSSYNDAAVITIARSGREGADLAMCDVPGHADASEHALQLEDNERDLIKHVKSHFKKVIVVINSANVMQIPELAAESGEFSVDAILWVGTTGRSSVEALGRILNGEVNPSGRTSDLWEKDFTKAPYWTNFGSQEQNTVDGKKSDAFFYYNNERTNFSTIEYREDIYTGYRYYETGFVDYNKEEAGKGTQWYDDQVQFAFGYGLGYTTFQWDVVPADAQTKKISAANESITVRVRVKNTGTVAGKDVVQLYYAAPYTKGGIEKSAANMVAYAKTDMLQPGQSQLVTLKLYAQDMASFDWNDANNNGFKGYELEKGDYELSVRHNSHDVEQTVIRTIDADMKCETDYENGNKLFPVFTGEYDSTTKSLLDNKISRATGMKQPATPTLAERTINKEQYDKLNAVKTYYSYQDKITDPWYVKDGVPTTWTQADSHAKDYSDVKVTVADVFGKTYSLDLVDNTVLQGTDEGSKIWEKFMNQFTWQELCEIAGRGEYIGSNFACFETVQAAGLDAALCKDGAIGINYTKFPGNGLLAATFNDKLAYEMGRMIGNEALDDGTSSWRAPACDLHRSPFGGRNCEYYSEDPFLSAQMTVQAVLGCASKGVNTEVKHLFANEQETYRDMYGGLGTMATEQALREIYYKPFDAAIKAGTVGLMASFNKIGMYKPAANNYALQEQLVRQQSGFIGSECTDAWTGYWTPLNLCVRTGTDNCLYDGANNQDANITIGVFDKANKTVKVPANEEAQKAYVNPGWAETIDEDSAALCTLSSATQYFAVRKAAQRILFTEVNTITNRNLIPTKMEVNVTMVRGVQNSVKIDIPKYTDIEFSGALVLPEGINIGFNADAGVLTGSPANIGDYTVTGLKAKVDGRMTSDLTLNINVASAFAYEGTSLGGEDRITLTAGAKSGEITIPSYRYGYFVPTDNGNNYNNPSGPAQAESTSGCSWFIHNVWLNPDPATASGKTLYVAREEDQMGNRAVVDTAYAEANAPYNGGYRFEIQGEAPEGITLEATTFRYLGFKGLDYYDAPSGFKFVVGNNVAAGTYTITVKFTSSVTNAYEVWSNGVQVDRLTYTDTITIVVT